MLNQLILWSLNNRAIVVGISILLLVFGYKAVRDLPVEVLPDLTKPTVTILTEAPGLAPEEVEALITRPIESSMMGIAGVHRLRSTSDIALSLVFVEFDWATDIYQARQFVQERLQATRESLPERVEPYLTPVASLMGEILLIGVRSTDGRLTPMDIRTLADWTIRRRLQTIAGVAEVLSMGGGVRQVQVQPDLWRMQAYGITLAELTEAVRQASSNSTGGFIESGSQEIMVRNLAMSVQLEDIARTVVKLEHDRPICIADVAEVTWGVEPMRGDASVNGVAGVVMSVVKAPGFDTISLTDRIEQMMHEVQSTLPEGVEATILFRQREFIDMAIGNLNESIRDGAIMVICILFLFLMNLRTTWITLMAMPLSFAITLLTFQWFGLSVNSMTLGGMAVAIGMVVDDAIVDVENVFRRLRENAREGRPKPRLRVIAEASAEVRNSILYATILIVLVFVPLLGLGGVEGRLFRPIAVATMISMIASFVVSLTAIPVFCSLLLNGRDKGSPHVDSAIVRMLKRLVRLTVLRLSLRQPLLVLTAVALMLSGALMLYPHMSKDFLPVFHEETAVLTTVAAPGTSLAEMSVLAAAVEAQIRQVPEVRHIGRRIGRAERSDHVIPVSNVEFDLDFEKGESDRTHAEIFDDIRRHAQSVPGTFSVLSGPLAHRISHLLSGVTAPVAIKIFGHDLEEVARVGRQIQQLARTIPGLENARLDQQATIPQLRIEVDRQRALAYGLTPGEVNETLSILLGGRQVTELREEERVIGLAIRLPQEVRSDMDKIRALPIATRASGSVPLSQIARVYEASGPNSVLRENTQRRYVVSITPSTRDAGALVRQLQQRVAEEIHLPEGVLIRYEGEFQAEREATRQILLLASVVLGVMVILLWTYFRSLVLALQVLLNLPLALMGSLLLTWVLVGNISIATLVGFVAVGGIAARNGILMISHYLHLMRHEGESFDDRMIERGTLERLVPVSMTALAAGIALVPFLMSMDTPGKEILGPVAVCIVGGLASSTLLDFAITPAVFRLFGRQAASRALEQDAPATR